MGAEKNIPGYSVMTFDTVSVSSNTVPGTNTFTVAPTNITSAPDNTLASPVSPPRVFTSAAPVVDSADSSEDRSSAQSSPSQAVAENASTGLTAEQRKTYIRWDHAVTTIFINNIMKPYYSDITGTHVTQLKHEKWEAMLSKFKSILSQNCNTRDMPTGNITIRKMQDKWTGLKAKFLSIQEIVSAEGYVGSPGDRKWPYYSMVEDVLKTVSSENTGVNIVSTAPASPPAIDLNPREQARANQLHENSQETGSSVVINGADTYTTRSDTEKVNETTSSETNIPHNRSVNTNGDSSGGSSSHFSFRKRRRESNDEDERIRDIVEVIEHINTQNMIRAQQNSERWIEALKEQGEIALKIQRDHHRQSMELQRAYIDTINGLVNRMRESDERWINLFSSFCHPANKRGSKDDDDVNKN